MIFDVQEILKNDGARTQVNGKLSLLEDFNDTDLTFSENASFSGEMVNIGGVLEFKGEATGSFTVPCARCMKETLQTYAVSFCEILAKETAEVTDRDAVIFFTGNEIDLDAVIWPNIFLELESRYLCKPDCKGLCSMCGKDLNEGDCGCDHTEIDPRLAGLKDLLK